MPTARISATFKHIFFITPVSIIAHSSWCVYFVFSGMDILTELLITATPAARMAADIVLVTVGVTRI